MNYLVTIQNNSYFYWQIELLIESFKLHNLQDSLVIGFADDLREGCPKNLAQHKRKFRIKQRLAYDYPPANQPLLAYAALKERQISLPFTLIHADTVLVNPPEPPTNNVQFSACPYFLNILKEDFCDVDEFIRMLNKPDLQPIPLGAIYQFNDIPLKLFEAVGEKIRMLLKKRAYINGKWERPFYKYANQLGWMLAFLDYWGPDRSVFGINMQAQLFDQLDENTKFIHYSKGYTNIFHKRMFQEDSLTLAGSTTPYEIFADPNNNMTLATNYMAGVAKSYLEAK